MDIDIDGPVSQDPLMDAQGEAQSHSKKRKLDLDEVENGSARPGAVKGGSKDDEEEDELDEKEGDGPAHVIKEFYVLEK
jgi:hypothetical protein